MRVPLPRDRVNIDKEQQRMEPVIQEEITGCAIASAAAIASIGYNEAKKVANGMGVFANDPGMWSESNHIRRLLDELGVRTSAREVPFRDWGALPDCALLSIKWRLARGRPYWHWVVFRREDGECYVLDSKKSLKKNIRTDFGRIKPKWYIEVYV